MACCGLCWGMNSAEVRVLCSSAASSHLKKKSLRASSRFVVRLRKIQLVLPTLQSRVCGKPWRFSCVGPGWYGVLPSGLGWNLPSPDGEHQESGGVTVSGHPANWHHPPDSRTTSSLFQASPEREKQRVNRAEILVRCPQGQEPAPPQDFSRVLVTHKRHVSTKGSC